MAKSSTKVNINLRNLRIKNELTIASLAKKLEISKFYYWQIENGNRRIYYDLALKIAGIFNKKPDDIFYDYFK